MMAHKVLEHKRINAIRESHGLVALPEPEFNEVGMAGAGVHVSLLSSLPFVLVSQVPLRELAEATHATLGLVMHTGPEGTRLLLPPGVLVSSEM